MSKGKLVFNVAENCHEGELATYHFYMKFKLKQRDGEIRENAPTHTIVGRAPAGHEFDAGVAWQGTVGKGESAGKAYFTMKFEDPKKITLNAWPGAVAGEFDIELERERPQEQANDAPDAVAAG